ncbi:MAG: enoyl-CoA hydratase [Actinobacteria bacterium]|nr:enoyl-CoA hydratase [Actinomycetota bacterium]
MSESAQVITTEIVDGVATITIDRTERRNALNYAALEALDAAVLDALAQGVKAIVFTGAGGHFCAGADLTELEDQTFDRRLRTMLSNVAEAPVLCIAAVSGACMGLGTQLAIACDVRVATGDAYFGIPSAKLGVVVNEWTLNRLMWTVGGGAARHMLLTAEIYRFEAARACGLVQVEGTLADAQDIAQRSTALAPLAIAGTKIGLNAAEGIVDSAAFEAAFETAWASADLVEGRTAFTERRTPNFEGR